jgi:hypothetical protein
VINDTTPGGHLGCALVMQRLVGGLQSAGMQVTQRLPLAALTAATLDAALRECDLVVVNGEGTLHHEGRGALLLAKTIEYSASRHPVALVNSVWQETGRAERVVPLISLAFVRESRSAAALAKLGLAAEVAPDLLLSAPAVGRLSDIVPVRGAITVFDHVSPAKAVFLSRWAGRNNAGFHPMAPRTGIRSLRTLAGYCCFMVMAGFPSRLRDDQLDSVLAAEVVVTGRFHGACLAIAAGRPFAAMASNSHKIEGMLDDARLGAGAIIIPDLRDHQKLSVSLGRAVDQLRALARDDQRLRYHREACSRYMARAKESSNRMFGVLKTLAESRS